MSEECFFCKRKDLKIVAPEVGISFGMYGNDYSFCHKCLTTMTAYKFWKTIFNDEGYRFPAKKKYNG